MVGPAVRRTGRARAGAGGTPALRRVRGRRRNDRRRQLQEADAEVDRDVDEARDADEIHAGRGHVATGDGDGLHGLGVAADRLPQLGAEVQIERRDRARGLRGLHRLDDHFRSRRRERGEDAARVEPANAAAEDRLPIEVARLEHGAGFVGTVVEQVRAPGTAR